MDKKTIINQLPITGRQFLKELELNNDRVWFEKHRREYEDSLLNPARDLVIALGARLRQLSSDIVADPRVDRSIFRINRDVRFSKDKSPYKTHLGIFFWEGHAPKIENSGYYWHLEAQELFFGAGLYIFPKWALERYRAAVSDEQKNLKLAEAIARVREQGGDIGGECSKRFPVGYGRDVAEPELLLYKGIYSLYRISDFNMIRNKDLVEFSYSIFRKLAPVHEWLRSIL